MNMALLLEEEEERPKTAVSLHAACASVQSWSCRGLGLAVVHSHVGQPWCAAPLTGWPNCSHTGGECRDIQAGTCTPREAGRGGYLTLVTKAPSVPSVNHFEPAAALSSGGWANGCSHSAARLIRGESLGHTPPLLPPRLLPLPRQWKGNEGSDFCIRRVISNVWDTWIFQLKWINMHMHPLTGVT